MGSIGGSKFIPTAVKGSNEGKDNVSKSAPTGVKKLSYREMMDRRSKGLCFNCDEKFSSGHICKNKQVFLITTEEGPELEEDSGELQVLWDSEEECNLWGHKGEDKAMDGEVSLHAMSGTRGLHTMQIQGMIKNRRVNLLLDSGSSHSFISQALVKQLKLPIRSCNEMQITIANGEKIQCNQVVEGDK